MEKRLKKQIIIASLFFYIIAAVSLSFYFFHKSPPTYPVTPLVKLEEVQILWVKLIPNGEFYDFVARIKNPNKHYGTKDLNYTIKLLDETGNLLGIKKDITYVLPDETKYIIVTFLKSEVKPVQAEIEFPGNLESEWRRLRLFEKPRILIRNVHYYQLENEPGFSEVSGVAVNKSFYDFDKVGLNVVLYNKEQEPIATARTQIRTLLAHSEKIADIERYFELTWYYPFEGDVEQIDVEAETNVFDLENFMRKYGAERKYDLYYYE